MFTFRNPEDVFREFFGGRDPFADLFGKSFVFLRKNDEKRVYSGYTNKYTRSDNDHFQSITFISICVYSFSLASMKTITMKVIIVDEIKVRYVWMDINIVYI